MPEKKEKKKPIFEKVGLVFRNPMRVDIVRELSTNSQRPIDLANKLEVDRQNINYHISALKRGGIVKTQKMEVSEEEASKLKGAIVNKVTKEGKLKISYGIELTKNGKDVVNQFVDPLYEEVMVEEEHKDESVKKKKKGGKKIMKNISIQIVEMLFENPLEVLELGKPQSHGNMTVIPIIYKGKTLEFISVKEAEKLGLISINETDTVSQLEVINNSDKQVLIPFGVTVHGGKQDRTIWEPILLAAGGKQNISGTNKGAMEQKYTIPAKCVEQSRWNYRKGKGFKSSNTRLHPNVAYEAISSAGQGSVWNEIQAYRSEMKYNSNVAPTQSYLEMTENNEKETEKIVKSFKNIEDQCGIATFINGEFIGIEFYANAQVWEAMSGDILKAFAIESLRFKDKPFSEKSEINEMQLITALQSLKLNFTTRKGIGLGEVVEFESQDKKWRGNTLAHENSLVQFYIVSKRGGSTQTNRGEQLFQTNVSQRYI